MSTYRDILTTYGVTLTTDPQDAALVSCVSLPREQARACVAALTAIGVEASEAPDNDDRAQSWLYVTPPTADTITDRPR